MLEPLDSLDDLCQSLYGREARNRDYSPYIRPGIVREAARVIDHLSTGFERRGRIMNFTASTMKRVKAQMKDVGDWIDGAKDRLSESAVLLRDAAIQADEQEDYIEELLEKSAIQGALMETATDRITRDGNYIEEQAEVINRLNYYESVLCFSPPSKMVMTPDGVCGMPEIEKITKIIEERDALRKELEEVKTERDEAQATLDSINDFMNQKGVTS